MQGEDLAQDAMAKHDQGQKVQITADDLRKHITGTYKNLRWGMAVVGLLLPPILYFIGRLLFGLSLQGSMSAYYHSSMGDVFVGALCAIGACLYLYKGYTTSENIALNIAGISAIAVAWFPMEWGCGTECKSITLHGACAALFFISIAFVCAFQATHTLNLIKDDKMQQKYRRTYKLLGFVMFVIPFCVWLLMVNLPFQQNPAVFFGEAFAIWIFGIYWVIKSIEIDNHTRAEEQALDREVAMLQDGLRNVKHG